MRLVVEVLDGSLAPGTLQKVEIYAECAPSVTEHVSDATSVEHMAAFELNAGLRAKLGSADNAIIVLVCLIGGATRRLEAGNMLDLSFAALAGVATI